MPAGFRRLRGLAAVMFLCAGPPLSGQSLEGAPRPEGEARPQAYLPSGTVDYRLLLPDPPAPGSASDQLDMAISLQLQSQTSDGRWIVAERDNDVVYPQFAEAFGRDIDRRASPRLVHLLNQVMRDVADPVFTGKDHFQRPRPRQRYQRTRVCGRDHPPEPDAVPRGGSSYPSGHAAYGWATALVLAQLAPERAPQLLRRAMEYGESRVICGHHFPGDVEAARSVAAAVIGRLMAQEQFLADLAEARHEREISLAP